MKIFLLTSFSGEIDAEGNVKAAFRTSIEMLLQHLRAAGHTVTCAIETEGWKMGDAAPEIGTNVDLQEIRASDAVVALFVETSAGMQFELGYATALGKRVILVKSDDVKLGWFISGVVNLKLATTTVPDRLIATLGK